MFKQLYQVLAI